MAMKFIDIFSNHRSVSLIATSNQLKKNTP